MKPRNHIQYTILTRADWAEGQLYIPEAFYMGVTQGSAIVQIRNRHFFLEYQSELHQFGGSLIQCQNMSDDFQARIFTYPRALLEPLFKAIGYDWYDFFDVNSFYQHVDDPRSQRTWREFNQWLDLARTLFSPESKIKYPQLQQENFLAGYWMWAIGTLQEAMVLSRGMSPAKMIYRRFLKLVNQQAIDHHDVKYYADILSISPRYLSKIVTECTDGVTPKQIIDRHLLELIKELLKDRSLTLIQIADQLNFPDQSYLSRFFLSPHRLLPFKVSKLSALMYPNFVLRGKCKGRNCFTRLRPLLC